MKEINLVVSLPNYKKRDNKYRMVRKATMKEKKDSEERQMRSIGTTDVQSKLAKDPMGPKDR